VLPLRLLKRKRLTSRFRSLRPSLPFESFARFTSFWETVLPFSPSVGLPSSVSGDWWLAVASASVVSFRGPAVPACAFASVRSGGSFGAVVSPCRQGGPWLRAFPPGVVPVSVSGRDYPTSSGYVCLLVGICRWSYTP
jgi:hypothetical protein